VGEVVWCGRTRGKKALVGPVAVFVVAEGTMKGGQAEAESRARAGVPFKATVMTLRLSRLRKPQLPPIHHVQVVEAATASGPASENSPALLALPPRISQQCCVPPLTTLCYRDHCIIEALAHLFGLARSLSHARALFLCARIYRRYLAY
jgi:hypothetical protein